MFDKFRLMQRAKNLRRRCERLGGSVEVIDAVQSGSGFNLVQKRKEFQEFLRRVNDFKPQVICDIGSAGGGTVRLFSHFAANDARILTIDLLNAPLRQSAFPNLVLPTQELTVFQGSSYAPATGAFVRSWLSGRSIDLLFIDGDHSYDGVSQDFRLYSPFVRPGGLVGFHDIVPDYKTRYGRTTRADVGDVPRFWNELKEKYSHGKVMQEIIEQPEQDGYGIGVIVW